MAFHTYPVERADDLEDASRYRFCSRDELVAAIDPGHGATVADFGSGTGFYTDEVAPHVDELYAVDVQSGMHDKYREKGLPPSVEPVTAAVDSLPFESSVLDAAFSTMTYHEYATPATMEEIGRVLGDGGRHVVVDWSSGGEGARGPPLAERFDTEAAVGHHEEAGFETVTAAERPETFVYVGRVQ